MALPGKLRFDSEDHPPASYYEELQEAKPRLPFQTPNPDEWVKAPEFVPRSKKLHDAFESPPPFDPSFMDMDRFGFENPMPLMEQPYIPGHQFPDPTQHPVLRTRVSVGGLPIPPLPPPFPMQVPPFAQYPPVPPPFAFVPNGYSANVHNINPGLGPPIPAIVLKKKRRRRNKDRPQSMLLEGESDSCSPPAPSDPKEFNRDSTGDRTTINEEDEDVENASPSKEGAPLGGSCPDLSQQQLEMWDDFLYESVVNGRGRASAERNMISHMQRSGCHNPAYETLPKALQNVMEEEYYGTANSNIRKLEKEINGNSMTASMILQSLKDKFARSVDAPGSTQKSLASELEELTFRPEISKYGYPQFDSDRHHVTSFHPDGFSSTMESTKIRIPLVEDSLEGMRIRVNAFEDDDDPTLSESDCPEPSRFQKLQWVIQQKKHQQMGNTGPPERVCCSVM